MITGPGQILAEKYRLISILGQGGMGSVWRAEHLALNSPVAVKLIDPSLIENSEALARFMREAQSAASLRSPHVVQILDYGMDGYVPFIVMELLEGESLAHRLARVRKLGLAPTALLLADVCRAVGRAHQAGIVHRDLKPDNIFIVSNDESEIAKVLDFGIAKSAMPNTSPGSGTRTGAMLGTPYYMSPEQASGSKTVDWRTDLWALGIIAFECVTGVRPFVAETLGGLVLAICMDPLPAPSNMAPVPPAFDEWFARATQRDRNARFQSAKELIAALRLACGLDEGKAYGEQPASNVTAGSNAPQVPSARPFVTTTGASAMSRTGTAVPPTTRTRRTAVVVGSILTALSFGGTVLGWRLLSTSDVSPPIESAAMPTAHLLSSPQGTSVSLPLPVPAPTTSVAPSAIVEAASPNSARPIRVHVPAPTAPSALPSVRPAEALAVPNRPLPSPVPPPTNAPATNAPAPQNAPAANTNTDPLGI